MIAGENHENAVYALRDTELLSMSRAGFMKLVRSDPEILERLTRVIMVRMRQARKKAPRSADPRRRTANAMIEKGKVKGFGPDSSSTPATGCFGAFTTGSEASKAGLDCTRKGVIQADAVAFHCREDLLQLGDGGFEVLWCDLHRWFFRHDVSHRSTGLPPMPGCRGTGGTRRRHSGRQTARRGGEAAGRKPSNEDARIVKMSLTDKTCKHLASLASQQEALNDFIFAEFGARKLDELTDKLAALKKRLEKACLKVAADL